MATELELVATKFLNELASDSAFKTLLYFGELIENKQDPEAVEVRLYEQIANLVEELKRLEANVRSYVRECRGTPLGDKLSQLYEEASFDGSGSLLKD